MVYDSVVHASVGNVVVVYVLLLIAVAGIYAYVVEATVYMQDACDCSGVCTYCDVVAIMRIRITQSPQCTPRVKSP